LFEDPSTRNLIAVKLFDSETSQAPKGSAAFIREMYALVLFVHFFVVRIVGYCLATRRFPTQIGTEFAAGESLR
jgi:hypothetical protein